MKRIAFTLLCSLALFGQAPAVNTAPTQAIPPDEAIKSVLLDKAVSDAQAQLFALCDQHCREAFGALQQAVQKAQVQDAKLQKDYCAASKLVKDPQKLPSCVPETK